MGASPHLATSAIISPAAFIRRNGNGGGLLPLPLQPGKMTGLLVAGGSTTAGVNFSSSTRVTRSNLGSKSKGRKPNRPARCLLPQDHHDSTTESDEPASAGNHGEPKWTIMSISGKVHKWRHPIFWQYLTISPIVTRFIFRVLILSTLNHWLSPPKTATPYIDDPLTIFLLLFLAVNLTHLSQMK